jgi:hypothetical protein
MMTTTHAYPPLTEETLINAIIEADTASVIVVGDKAQFAAKRILYSHDLNGKPTAMFGLLKVHVDSMRDPDAWELF